MYKYPLVVEAQPIYDIHFFAHPPRSRRYYHLLAVRCPTEFCLSRLRLQHHVQMLVYLLHSPEPSSQNDAFSPETRVWLDLS